MIRIDDRNHVHELNIAADSVAADDSTSLRDHRLVYVYEILSEFREKL